MFLQTVHCHGVVSTAINVSVVYRGEGHYTLSIGDSPPIEASSWLDTSDRVGGFLGEKTFQADVAMVDRQLHVFTNVSPVYGKSFVCAL